MYSMSSGYTQYINIENRTVSLTVKINNTAVNGNYIVSAEFTESASEENITMGSTCAKVLTLKVRDNIGVSLTGANISITMGLGQEQGSNGIIGSSVTVSSKCPLGYWIVTETKKSNGIITITAYDKMAFLTDNYEPTVTFPATCKEVIEDIKKQYGFATKDAVTYKNINTTDKLITKAITCTVREMIGYIAGLNGCNAVFNRDNYLDFRFYSSTVNKTLDTEVYSNSGSEESEETYTITALVSGEGENEITSGSGKAITFANPYMTQEILDGIVSSKLPFTYSSGKVKYTGNPCLEAGDVVQVQKADGTSFKLAIMLHKLTYSGGLYGNIESYGKSENGDTISNYKSETASIAHKITDVEEIQNNILGAKGGYYELLLDANDNNRPFGTAWWKDQEKTQGWKFTYGGLGFFQNDGLKNIGLDNQGNVIATNIAANSLLTNSFKIGKSDSDYAMSFDGSTGKINFGSGVSMSWADITDTPTIPTSTSELTNDSGYITDGDIPSKTSDLTNDSGFINSATATTITNNAISTASISANQITTGTLSADRVGAGSFTMTGGSIKVETDAADTSVIKLSYENSSAEFSPDGIWLDFKHATTGQTIYTSMMTSTSIYLSNSSGNTQIAGGSIQLDGSDVITTASLSGYGFYSADDDIKVGEIKSSTTYSDTVSYATNMYIGTTGILHRTTKTSSRDVKHDIAPLTDATINAERLYDVGVIQFKYNDDVLSSGDERYDTLLPGFIVEDMINAYPIAVDVEDGKAFQWNEQYLLPPMLKLIQDQHKQIEDLTARVAALEEKQ